MKKLGLIVVALALTLAGCNSDEKKASELFQRAEVSFAAEDYSLAKLQIDSIRTLYPKAFEVRKAAIGLMQQVDLKEQQQTLAYLDSVMAVKQASLDSIKGNYVLEKDTAYQEVGNYFYPTQVVEKNIGRSFLRAQVSETGEMSLTSIYCAGGNIHHTAVKVSVGDLFAETPSSSDSYETTDLGRAIVANQDKKNIRLEFMGDRNYRTVMPASDVKAIVAIVDLAKILSAMEEIRKEQKEANLKIQFVTRKMQEKAGEAAE